jgi:hypothetical protein
VNEARLAQFISSRSYPPQFIILGDGYLFSDRALTWVGARHKRTWQFGPPPERTRSGRRAHDRFRFFGDPVVQEGKLFVSALDGCVYVFDVGRITHTGE